MRFTVMAMVPHNLWLGLAILAIYCDTTQSIDVTFEPPSRGYFLRPLSDKLTNPLRGSRTLYIPRSQDSTVLEAHYGPFSARRGVEGNRSRITPSYRLGQYDFSAHILSNTVKSRDPKVFMLGHLSLLNVKNNKGVSDYHQLHKWCFLVEIHQEKKVTRGSCVVNDHDNTCVSTVRLSPDWFTGTKASVLYVVYPVNREFECSTDSNLIVPDRLHSIDAGKRYLGDLTLVNEGVAKEFREMREDQHILVDLPMKPVFPRSLFHVPVKLQAESDLQHFVVRVKTKFGLRIIGARSVDPKRWQITVDINHKQRMAMITAYVTNARDYAKSSSIQEIFVCDFAVDNRTSGEVQVGKVIWTFEYASSHELSHYGDPYRKVVSRIVIQHDRIKTIVPVVKEKELMNTAILTGQMAVHPISVYGVSEAGKVIDITSQVMCYSLDEQVLKVTPPCNNIYLDSTTTRGSVNTSVVIKYGHHTSFVYFKVWVPEIPLYIHVDDPKLSLIKGWKVPMSNSRRKRGVDFGLLTYPSLLLKEKATRVDSPKTCLPRYQQTEVKVYTRFYTNTGDKKEFVVSPKAYLDVTDIVLSRLRVSDGGVVTLRRNVVQGQMPGKADVQVWLPNGRIVGTTEVRVATDKVSISQLAVTLVSGVSLRVQPGADLAGTYTANVDVESLLYAQYQEGVIDLTVQFSDGTFMPLSQVVKDDYSLNINSFDNHVIVFGPSYSNELPRVIAVGQGKGPLIQVELALKDTCQRKKYRPLKFSSVYVDVDFNNFKYKDLQSDAGNYGYDNGKWNQPVFARNKDVENSLGKLKSIKQDSFMPPATLGPKSEVVYMVTTSDPDLPKDVAGVQAERVRIHPASEPMNDELSPLEIGMYVLLGVFSVAVVVFMVNCVIYFMRYKRKRVSDDGVETLAPVKDWVWIGKTTLERNQVNTQLNTALMPEEDFNDNPSVASRPPSASDLTHKRNSGVSTYKGSECSIRITANPCESDEMSDNESMSDDAFDHPVSEGEEPELEHRVLGMTSEQFAEYFANLKESCA